MPVRQQKGYGLAGVLHDCRRFLCRIGDSQAFWDVSFFLLPARPRISGTILAAIRALARQAVQAENNEDLEAWLNTVADDAVILTAEGPLKGKDAIREGVATSFTEADWESSWTLEAIEISGNLAVMWGPFELKTTPRDGGLSSHTVGYHLDVARRQPDGSWKYTWWTLAEKPVSDTSVE